MCLLSFIIITNIEKEAKIIEQVIGEWAKSLKCYAYTHCRHWNTLNGLPCRRIKHETISCRTIYETCVALFICSALLHSASFRFSWSICMLQFQFEDWNSVSTHTYMLAHCVGAHIYVNLAKWYSICTDSAHTLQETTENRNQRNAMTWLWYVLCGR